MQRYVKVNRKTLALLFTLLLVSNLFAWTSIQPVKATNSYKLHVVGTHLEDENNNTVHLRSTLVDRNERLKEQGTLSYGSSPSESWFTSSDLEILKSYNANCFEVHMDSFNDWSSARGVLDTTYFTTWMDYWVNSATTKEMYVILDVCPFNYYHYWNIPDWIWEDAGYEEPTNKAEWDVIIRDFFDTDISAMDISRTGFIDVWKAVANRYKTNDYVIFSIMDEPLVGVDKVNEITATHLGETYSEFMENVVDGIHATGSENIILVDRPFVTNYSPYWGNVKPVNKNGIVWRTAVYIDVSKDNYAEWCETVDVFANKFMASFGKPFQQSGFGFNPVDYGESIYPSTWLDILENQTIYLETTKSFVGRNYHNYGSMEGEIYDYAYDYFTSEQSDDIMTIAFAGIGGGESGEQFVNSGWEDSNGTDIYDDEKWTGTNVYSGDSINVSSTDAHHGSYHAHAWTNGIDTDIASVYMNITAQSTLYLRAYFKFVTALPSEDGKSLTPIEFRTEWNPNTLVRITNVAGVNKWRIMYWDGETQYSAYYEPSIPIALNTWYCVQAKTVIHETTGEYRLYVWGGSDNGEVITVTGKNSTKYGNIDRVFVGECGATPLEHSVYVDCVILSTQNIGEEDYSPPPPVSVYLTVISPEELKTYSTGNISVEMYASGGTIDKIWFNCKNDTDWIFESNQTYTAITQLTNLPQDNYVFHGWANNTDAMSTQETVYFSHSASETSGWSEDPSSYVWEGIEWGDRTSEVVREPLPSFFWFLLLGGVFFLAVAGWAKKGGKKKRIYV